MPHPPRASNLPDFSVCQAVRDAEDGDAINLLCERSGMPVKVCQAALKRCQRHGVVRLDEEGNASLNCYGRLLLREVEAALERGAAA